MKVDIIIHTLHGVPQQQHVVENETTAEAKFDSLCRDILGGDWEEFDTNIDYGLKHNYVNQYLRPLGQSIIWLTQVSVNNFKN